MKWEYDVKYLGTAGFKIEELNAIGSEGWELVSVTAVHVALKEWALAIFKRPVPNDDLSTL